MSGDGELVYGEDYKSFIESQGYRVVIPAANQIQIDIDTTADLERYAMAAAIFFSYVVILNRTQDNRMQQPSLRYSICKLL